MKTIELTRGKVALVDDEDFEELDQYNWYALASDNDCFYACRSKKLDGKKRAILMHKVITGLDGVDHIDRNGLNNQKYNLRPATPSQQKINATYRNSSSGYKGVTKITGSSRWQANICKDYTVHYIGSYDTPEEAARARDKKAVELHGQFAWLNFPEEYKHE